MAVFGRDFYGLSKYGANVFAEFDVNPFDANPDGYGAIRVTWHSPSGVWDGIRLIRSRTGYAVNENDGTVLVDSANDVDHFVDQSLQGGSFYYYTLFIHSDDGWSRAGATSSLAVKKPWIRQVATVTDLIYELEDVPYGHADLMWERIPAYFRYVRRQNTAITDEYVFAPSTDAFLLNPDNYDQVNQHLHSLLDVLGYGLDYVHNYQETLLLANDPHTAHMQDVNRLAEEMGIDFEFGVPASVMRSKVANAALLARRRGTLEGLKDVASLTTGWDIDVEVSQNLFLNRDQSEFANPIFPEWDSGTNYATGQKVQYEGRIFTALQGAYGDADKPPETGTDSNTFWTVTTDTDVTTLHRADTDGVVTWKGFTDGTTPKTLALAIGVSDPISGVGQESNSLVVRNTSNSHTYDVLGASNLVGVTDVLPQQQQAIRQGIPVPRPDIWDETLEYGLGLYVQHRGICWRSIGTSTAQEPVDDSLYWEKVGLDDRPLLAYSLYANGSSLNRINLSTNPSFESNTTGYSAVTANTTLTRVTSGGFSGAGPCYCQVTRTGTVTGESVLYTVAGLTVGHTYTVSAYGEVGAIGGAGPKLQISSSTVNGTATPLSGWTRASVTFVATATTEAITFAFTLTSSQNGINFGLDSVQIEEGDTATDLFTGATADTGGHTYTWTGTANNSTSLDVNTSQGVVITPGLAFFDEQGNVIRDLTDLTIPDAFTFDTFNHAFGTPDYGDDWDTTGLWDTEAVEKGDDPIAYPVDGSGVALQTTSLTEYRVAATYATAAATGHNDGLVIRYQDADNFMMVTRTAVTLTVDGTPSVVGDTFDTPIADGDRVTMKINDTDDTFVLLVNGDEVASGDLTGDTKSVHGIMVT